MVGTVGDVLWHTVDGCLLLLAVISLCRSTRLAYEDFTAAQKRAEQQQLRDLNPHQQKQLERLGMGGGRVRYVHNITTSMALQSHGSHMIAHMAVT